MSSIHLVVQPEAGLGRRKPFYWAVVEAVANPSLVQVGLPATPKMGNSLTMAGWAWHWIRRYTYCVGDGPP